MQKFDASYWEIYTGKSQSTRKTIREIKREKRDSFNSFMKGSARKNAKSMRKEPSVLEQKMQLFLDAHGINYEFQKILYIKGKSGYINKYYITDFYIPEKKVIIETDGKFHDDQVEQDTERTVNILKYCGDYRIIRWRWHDFQSINKIRNLLSILK